MIVDSVKEVVDLEENQIEPSPVLGNEHAMSFVRGMGKVDNKVVILVDIVSAFSPEQMGQMSAFSHTEEAA
ncbi:purine-binding chemotaxis protein [compost metagenome]